MQTSCPVASLTVLGLGLIGGSWAAAFRQQWPDTPVWSIDPAGPQATYQSLAQWQVFMAYQATSSAVAPHLLVLASHLQVNQQALQSLEHAWCQQHGVLVTDVGSVKTLITQIGLQHLPQHFIGGHPMAGREQSGLAAACAQLYQNKVYWLCPHEQTPPEAMAILEAVILQALGGLPRQVLPQDHDRWMAWVSHLPQVYSVALANSLAQHPEYEAMLQAYGGGLDGQIRLAGSAYAMWGPILAENAPELILALDTLQAQLTQLKQALTQGHALSDDFATANAMYRQFQQKKA